MSFVYKKCLGRALIGDQDVFVHWFTIRPPALMIAGGSRLVGRVHADGSIESYEDIRRTDIFHWPPRPLCLKMGNDVFQPAKDLALLADAVEYDNAEGKQLASIYWMADHPFAIGIAFTEESLVSVALDRGYRVPDGHGYNDQWFELERSQTHKHVDVFA